MERLSSNLHSVRITGPLAGWWVQCVDLHVCYVKAHINGLYNVCSVFWFMCAFVYVYLHSASLARGLQIQIQKSRTIDCLASEPGWTFIMFMLYEDL